MGIKFDTKETNASVSFSLLLSKDLESSTNTTGAIKSHWF